MPDQISKNFEFEANYHLVKQTLSIFFSIISLNNEKMNGTLQIIIRS
jgi:hypothetical protein